MCVVDAGLQTILRCKVVVVGDGAVGKTAITQMLHSGGQTYPKNYVMVRHPPIPSLDTRGPSWPPLPRTGRQGGKEVAASRLSGWMDG